MKAVLLRVLPKAANAGRARHLITSRQLSPLTLPAVVALTRANMFVPEGSIRAGVVKDLVEEERSKRDSIWVEVASLALALIARDRRAMHATSLSARRYRRCARTRRARARCGGEREKALALPAVVGRAPR